MEKEFQKLEELLCSSGDNQIFLIRTDGVNYEVRANILANTTSLFVMKTFNEDVNVFNFNTNMKMNKNVAKILTDLVRSIDETGVREIDLKGIFYGLHDCTEAYTTGYLSIEANGVRDNSKKTLRFDKLVGQDGKHNCYLSLIKNSKLANDVVRDMLNPVDLDVTIDHFQNLYNGVEVSSSPILGKRTMELISRGGNRRNLKTVISIGNFIPSVKSFGPDFRVMELGNYFTDMALQRELLVDVNKLLNVDFLPLVPSEEDVKKLSDNMSALLQILESLGVDDIVINLDPVLTAIIVSVFIRRDGPVSLYGYRSSGEPLLLVGGD